MINTVVYNNILARDGAEVLHALFSSEWTAVDTTAVVTYDLETHGLQIKTTADDQAGGRICLTLKDSASKLIGGVLCPVSFSDTPGYSIQPCTEDFTPFPVDLQGKKFLRFANLN